MKKIILIMSLLLLFVVSCGASKVFSVDVEGKGEIPNFELKDLNGKKTESKKIFQNGKKTLFIIAAEWCPHCRTELPEVQKFYEENKDRVNVVVIFTSKKTTLANTKKYVTENNFTFPVYYDMERTIMNAFKVKGVPYNLKIQNSKIEGIHEGIIEYSQLVELFNDYDSSIILN
mgnify:FL=1